MKKYAIAFLILGALGAIIGFKTYHKPHQDMHSAKATQTLSATDLFAAYQANEGAANTKYLDQVIAVTGTVRESSKEEGVVNVMLESEDMMFGVRCQLDQLSPHKRQEFSVGEKISLKGKCTGSLMDVVMVRCVEI